MTNEIIDLKNYITAINKIWSNSYYTTMSVLLQNMVAKENIHDDEKYCGEIVDVFEALFVLRPDDHVVETAYKELSMIITGHFWTKSLQTSL